ncbi:MAG: TolC family protein [Gemmatimonadetes bacterium]|nr:TolC family protein [Gemmatimonadota bacterium]
MKKYAKRLGLCAAGWLVALPVQAAGQDPVGRQQAQAAQHVVGQALPPLEPAQTMVSMTLEQAIARALESNLDIQSARLSPVIQEWALRNAEAAFSPTFSMTMGYNNATNQSTSQLDGGARTSTERYTLNTSLSKTMPWYGGRLSFGFNNSRNETTNTFATRNPSYSSSVSLNYSQPLLSGFRTDNQRAALETAEIQTRITDLQVQSQIENISHQVRLAYWALRAAIEQIEIQRLNLAQAEQQLEENRIRVQLGRMTDLQLVQTEAQVASAQQALLNAEIQWRNQEFAFKRLLLAGADDPLLAWTVNPTDQPIIIDQPVDIQAAIDIAMRERADIRQQRQQREISVVDLDVSRSSTLPDVTLTAAYSLQGVGGDLFARSGLGGEPELVQAGGYSDGLRSIRDFDTPTWSLTLNASYPLGMNGAKTNLERARLQLRQADLALRSQELAIITQVTTAGLAVRNSYLQYEAARRSREAAERNAETQVLRYGVGVAIGFEVVSAQNDLTQARLSELQAIINHVNVVAELERVQRVGN